MEKLTTNHPSDPEDLVGISELAYLTHETETNIRQMKHNGKLPEPDITFRRMPIWRWRTVQPWVTERNDRSSA